MLILLEGLDRTGKSTLAELIASQVGAELRHYSKPEQHPLDEYERSLDDYHPLGSVSVVCDRFHWGERIWPTVYDRASDYTSAAFRHTELYLLSRGAVMVACTGDPDSIAQRITDDLPPREWIQPALDMFHLAADQSLLPVIEYDFEAGLPAGSRHVPDLVVDLAIARLQDAARVWRVTDHWVGDPYPRVVLVGDEPSTAYGDGATRAPFSPYGGSAEFLFDTLDLEDLRGVAVTNRADANGAPVDLHALDRVWNAPRWVALGQAADTALTLVAIPHETVPHPQWVKRFRYHHQEQYRRCLKQAMRGEGPDLTWT